MHNTLSRNHLFLKLSFIFILFLSFSYASAQTYYVSNTGLDTNNGTTEGTPWQTLVKVNGSSLVAGDSVLFKRGDSWFGTLIPRNGTTGNHITYAAYGTGEKPILHNSVTLNSTSDWIEESNHVWKTIRTFNYDVGNVIFNNEQSVGVKKWNKTDLISQGQYWYDTTNKLLYIYSASNPASFYTEVRACLNYPIVNMSSRSNITLDNLAVRYGAANGIHATNSNGIIITNCDVSWIGGGEFGAPTRYGNGIQFYASAQNVLVENCRIWEMYDTGITNQYQPTTGTIVQSNITYRNNIIWNSEYSFEYFNRSTGGETSNILIENNTFNNSGSGWAHAQRPDPSGYHLRLAGTPANTTNFIIRNNIFSEATGAIHRNWHANNPQYTIDYNTITQTSGNIAFLNSTYYSDFATYQSASGWDTHSTFNSQPVITPPSDTTAPVVTFSIPTTSTTLLVSISTLSATDAVGVTGYLLSESSTTPNAGSGPWSSTPQPSYTFLTSGTKTLYAFAKDVSGNVSLPSSDTITITLPPSTYTLTINKLGTGSGIVTGGNTYNSGTVVTATAIPDTGSTFTSWTGDCSTLGVVTMTANKTCTATFTLIPVVSSGGGGGGGGGGYTPPPTTTITCPTGSTLSNNTCINNTTLVITTPTLTTTPTITTVQPSTPSYTFTTRMTLGTKGTEVLKLQEILISKGYLTGTPDGSYGPKTLTAVKAFQRAFNLTPDGIIGIQGRAILNNTTITPTYTPTTPTLPTTSLLTDKLVFRSKANNISQVKLLQTILTSKGYLSGTIDGIFGRGTLMAVKSFQLNNNLTPDGIVGAKSRELLNK